jgi:hypothetical protein
MTATNTVRRAPQPVPHSLTFGPRPFDLEPLRRRCELLAGERLGGPAVAAMLGEHKRQLQRWSRYGFTEAQADEMATRLGLHPALIWSNWWEATAPGASGPDPRNGHGLNRQGNLRASVCPAGQRRTTVTVPRFPLDRLHSAAANEHGLPVHVRNGCVCGVRPRPAGPPPCLSTSGLARLLDVDQGWLYRQARAGLRPTDAVELSQTLGLRPEIVWPDWRSAQQTPDAVPGAEAA